MLQQEYIHFINSILISLGTHVQLVGSKFENYNQYYIYLMIVIELSASLLHVGLKIISLFIAMYNGRIALCTSGRLD